MSNSKATAKVAKANACGGYRDAEIEEMTETEEKTLDPGTFLCGIYLGNLQEEKWVYNFEEMTGSLANGGTCFKLIKK